MLALAWNLSAALNGYLRLYMPTNRAVDWLRTPPATKWAIPVALVATAAYLVAMSICATIVQQGGPGYLNVLVLLFSWNALKFAALTLMTGLRWLPRLASRSTLSAAMANRTRPSRFP